MDLENKWARPAVAALFNRTEGCRWIPNRLVEYARPQSAQVTGYYPGGTPDAFVCWHGRFIAVEVKAGQCGAALGNPLKPDATVGWHAAQENWYNQVAVPSHMAYYIALWVLGWEPEGRVYQDDAFLMLVPPAEWVALRTLATAKGAASVPLRANDTPFKDRKELAILPRWEEYRCHYVAGQWVIPQGHSIRGGAL